MEESRPITGRWRLSAGAVWRSFGDAIWDSGPSYSSRLVLPSLVGSERHPGFGSAGPLGGHADREYTDGFVRIGSPTAATGDTSNWGYTSASQVSGDAVDFHTGAGSSSGLFRGSDPSESDWTSDDTDGFGPYLSLDYLFDVHPRFALGPQFSFRFTRFDVANQSTDFRAFQERRDYANSLSDAYGLDGSIPPAPPYAGSFGGPGILLRNIPDSRAFHPRQTAADRADLWNSVRDSVEVDFYTFSLGPQFEYRFGRFSGRHDWNEDISGTVGPSSYHIDMDAWTVGASVNWKF